MKNLPRVLVFSAVLALAAGCPKNSGEAPGPGDAAATAPEDSGAAPSDGPQTGTSRGAVMAPGDAGTADAGTLATDAGMSDAGTRAMAPAAGGNREAQEACLDRFLKANKLDRYGNPEGTMYAGGTPLFDERTGESKDRLDYVYERKPEARKACGGGAATK
jgi:hypothetical protein